MDLSTNGVEVRPEKIEDPREEVRHFHCDLSDTEMVNKVADELLSGLATGCVDSTTGDIFRSPATVAVDLRKEMVEYLNQRSESSVAESVILEGASGSEASVHPLDIISVYIDDFMSLKRNLFGRVSGWLLSEMREDKIDDFVQEMELNSFWSLDRREAIAQTLLKNVDFKNTYHCDMKFKSAAELDEHRLQCGFRTVGCENEGCVAKVSAALAEKHDSCCPFKVLPCEQKCPEFLLRREMDKHCITVCPMKLVSCPFYSIGCQSSVPQCTVSQHCSESLHPHLLYTLRYLHKKASVEDLRQLAYHIEMSPDSSQLSEVRDVRSLTTIVKKIEAKLGSFELDLKHKDNQEDTTTSDKATSIED